MKNKLLIPIGIDWADVDHAFHLVDPSGPAICGTFKQDPKAIEDLIGTWRKRFPGATFALAIETTKGPLISALLKYDDVVIYPVNPAALASYRRRSLTVAARTIPATAQLLAQYLQHYLDQLRPLRHDEPLTRELASLKRTIRNSPEPKIHPSLVEQRNQVATDQRTKHQSECWASDPLRLNQTSKKTSNTTKLFQERFVISSQTQATSSTSTLSTQSCGPIRPEEHLPGCGRK